jgi:hypothetical protein
MTIWRRWAAIGCVAAAVLPACGGSPAQEAADVGAEPPRPEPVGVPAERSEGAELAGSGDPGTAEAAPPLGAGFVVWESNRGGAWRIWIRELAGGEPRRLSPDETGRDHCCPHISPDGSRVAYLSAETLGGEYPPDGTAGRLHLIAPDGGGDRLAAPAARSYFEHRAVVWRSAGELIHIDGERATVALDLASGVSRRLADPPAELGWLIDATLSWATAGRPAFSPYDAERRVVVPRRRLGGCQPYFSSDGRWGYWTAGAGGPIDRLRLADGRIGRILDKNDPRVPDGFGYAYFPMLAADGRLFAWAASQGGHDHFRADYEVFVAESDPDTLDLLGAPVRITRHPAVDRFPDVWQPPLELGRHAGEVPLTVSLTASADGVWRWSLGDGAAAEGAAVEHTWSAPGRYEVVARRDGQARRGLVVARPARPPRPLAATARAGGIELAVAFDEPIDAGDARLELASGARIAGLEVATGGRALAVRLAEPLRRPDRLTISGVRDRAERPNTMAPATLELEPPAWPASRAGLVFLWETADAANLVRDPELGADRATTLTAAGGARLDAGFAMLLDGGSFVLGREETPRLRAAIQGSNEVSLEAIIEPGGADGQIVTWASEKAINLWLEQRSGRLVFGLRTGARGPEAHPRVELFELPAGRPAHVVITYEPGRLTAYLDGEALVGSAEAQSGFYHWRNVPLTFGDGRWRGRLEGVAIYDRVVSAAEAAEAHRLARARLAARRAVPRSVVEARLVARSRVPTLAEISPYREAVFAVDYRVERTLEGPPVAAELRAVQWAILDGTAQPVTRAAAGERLRLTLEPFAAQPQLESVYLADTLEGGRGQPFYVVDAAPVR